MAKTQCVLDIMMEKNYITINEEYWNEGFRTKGIPLLKIAILTKNVPTAKVRSIIFDKIHDKIQEDEDFLWNSNNTGFYVKRDVEQYVKEFLESDEKRDVSCLMHPWLRTWIAEHYDCIELKNKVFINTQAREQRIKEEEEKSNEALELLKNIL